MPKARRAVDLSAARSFDAQLTQEGFSSIHEYLCTKAVKSSHGVELTFIDNKMTFESMIEQIMSLERISILTTYHSHCSSHARNLELISKHHTKKILQ